MNSIKKLVAQPQISVFGHSTEVSPGIIRTKGDTNILFTNLFANLFPIKNYQNYFREETDADHCSLSKVTTDKNLDKHTFHQSTDRIKGKKSIKPVIFPQRPVCSVQ
jgi:hypothetical protein